MIKTTIGHSLLAATGAAVMALPPVSAGAQDLGAARALIEQHSQLPNFTPPGEPFDARSCAAGKRMLTIPVSSANPFTKNITLAMQEVGEQIGLEVVEWENQARPTQWVQGIEFAINNDFDVVDLLGGVNPAVLGPQIAAARSAGVEIYASHFNDTSQTIEPEIDYALPVPYNYVGKVLAAWVTMQTEGDANVLIIGSDEILPTGPFVQGITDGLAELCGPQCGYSYINAPVPEWATKIQTSVQSALIADSTINYIVPIYDSMSQFVIPAVTITGRRDSVNIATFNGTPFVIDAIQAGNVEMDIGESIGWIGRSIIDGYLRSMCDLPTYDELYVPFYIFDDGNAADAGSPAGYDQGYGDQHVAGYNKLWGLD